MTVYLKKVEMENFKSFGHKLTVPFYPGFTAITGPNGSGKTTLINVITALDKIQNTGDIATGVQILKRALEEPLRQLAENAGFDGAVVVQEVRRAQKEKNNLNIGFDVLAEDYGDMVEKGIIDPAKVTRSALENAASIAAMILTTEALVTDLPEKEKPAAAPQMPEY